VYAFADSVLKDWNSHLLQVTGKLARFLFDKVIESLQPQEFNERIDDDPEIEAACYELLESFAEDEKTLEAKQEADVETAIVLFSIFSFVPTLPVLFLLSIHFCSFSDFSFSVRRFFQREEVGNIIWNSFIQDSQPLILTNSNKLIPWNQALLPRNGLEVFLPSLPVVETRLYQSVPLFFNHLKRVGWARSVCAQDLVSGDPLPNDETLGSFLAWLASYDDRDVFWNDVRKSLNWISNPKRVRGFSDVRFFATDAVPTGLGLPSDVLPYDVARCVSTEVLTGFFKLGPCAQSYIVSSALNFRSNNRSFFALLLAYVTLEADSLRREKQFNAVCTRLRREHCVPVRANDEVGLRKPADCYVLSASVDMSFCVVDPTLLTVVAPDKKSDQGDDVVMEEHKAQRPSLELSPPFTVSLQFLKDLGVRDTPSLDDQVDRLLSGKKNLVILRSLKHFRTTL
jgi:hypothetical protein